VVTSSGGESKMMIRSEYAIAKLRQEAVMASLARTSGARGWRLPARQERELGTFVC
jgi:hypothetical protein